MITNEKYFLFSLMVLYYRVQLFFLPAAKITGADALAHPFDNPAPPPSIYECSSSEMSEVTSDSSSAEVTTSESSSSEDEIEDVELGTFLLDALSGFDPQADVMELYAL